MLDYLYVMDKQEVSAFIEANRNLWNKRTSAHVDSEFYDVKSFLDGKSSLNKFELDLLGDINGKSLLHLQCHFGQDTLSLARMGAKTSGVDFSATAVEAARNLNDQLGLKSKFYCNDVFETRKYLSETFDIVFTSYGTIGWLPKLQPWAKVVAESLNTNGIFVMCDFHPFVWIMDEEYRTIKYSYFNLEVIESETTGSYASHPNLHEPLKEFGWNHSFSDLLGALLAEGLQLEIFNEYDGSPYNCFPEMEIGTDGLFRFSHWGKKIPLVYGIRFRKLQRF